MRVQTGHAFVGDKEAIIELSVVVDSLEQVELIALTNLMSVQINDNVVGFNRDGSKNPR